MINRNSNPRTLVLGLGNIIMGDEGIGVHVIRALVQYSLPPNIECLDGGTGGFILLEPLQNADRIILVDATTDGNAGRESRCDSPYDHYRSTAIHFNGSVGGMRQGGSGSSDPDCGRAECRRRHNSVRARRRAFPGLEIETRGTRPADAV